MVRVVLICLVCLASAVSKSLASGSWSYDNELPDGPDHWVDSYPLCGGVSQSPINLDSNSGAFAPGGFILSNYSRVQTTPFTLTNSGHSIQVSVNAKDITIYGGGLKGTYVLEQFHFHWGKDSSTGSEHLVDSASYPLEIHLVHYSDIYADVASAAASGDTQAIAVLGVFVQVAGGTPSVDLGNIADASQRVPYKGNTTSLAAFALQNILPFTKLWNFYRYSGSLTTPACNEVVVWTVFSEPIYIDELKLEKFRQLHENAAGEADVLLDYNYRPTQPLNGRIVKKSTGS